VESLRRIGSERRLVNMLCADRHMDPETGALTKIRNSRSDFPDSRMPV